MTMMETQTESPVLSRNLETRLRELLASGTHRIVLVAQAGVVTSVQPVPEASSDAAQRIRELEAVLTHARGIADVERRRAELLEAARGLAWRAVMGAGIGHRGDRNGVR